MSREYETDRLLARHEEHVGAWNERDLDALAALYAPDCLIFDTYAPPAFHGFADFRRRVEPALDRYEEFSLETLERVVRVDERADDRIGWIASRYRLESVRDGQAESASGRWTEIYEKRNGRWLLVHLHTSPDPSND